MKYKHSPTRSKIGFEMTTLATLQAALWLGLSLPVHAAGQDHSITAPGDCSAFLLAIGADGQETTDAAGNGGVCAVKKGTLPVGVALSVGNGWTLWVQGNGGSARFTNRGTVNLNSAQLAAGSAELTPGNFDNQGTLNINGDSASFAALFNTGTVNVAVAGAVNSLGVIHNTGVIYNVGQVKSASKMSNTGMIANACGGKLIATGGVADNPPINLCHKKPSPQVPASHTSG